MSIRTYRSSRAVDNLSTGAPYTSGIQPAHTPAPTLRPKESYTTVVWVPHTVVTERSWGIFVDNTGYHLGSVAETNEFNNHCTDFANP